MDSDVEREAQVSYDRKEHSPPSQQPPPPVAVAANPNSTPQQEPPASTAPRVPPPDTGLALEFVHGMLEPHNCLLTIIPDLMIAVLSL